MIILFLAAVVIIFAYGVAAVVTASKIKSVFATVCEYFFYGVTVFAIAIFFAFLTSYSG